MRMTGTVYISPLQNGDRRLSNCERSTDGTKSMALRRKRMKQSSSGTVCALGAASVGAGGGSDCSIADVGEQMQSRRRLLTRERLTHEPERRALNRRLRCSSRKPLESWKSSSREGTKSDLSRETSQMSTTRSEVFQASAEYSKHADDVHSRDSTYNNRIWRLTGSKLWRGAS